MRIKKSDIIKALVFFAILINLSFQKIIKTPLSDTINIYMVTVICALISVGICVSIYGIKKQYINIVGIWLIFATLVCMFSTLKTGMPFRTLMLYCIKYFMVLLSIPVVYLLREKMALDRFLSKILNLTVLALAMRTMISLFQQVSGVVVFSDIALENAAENWFRNGYLRLNPASLSIILIPVAMYLFYSEAKRKRRIRYVLIIAFMIYYTTFIHGSRAVLVYDVIVLLFCILIKRRDSKRSITIFFSVALIAIILVNSPIATKFFLSFTSGEQYGSTWGRMDALPYFFNMAMRHPFMGNGFLTFEDTRYIGKEGWVVATLPDLGMLSTMVQFGISGVIFYTSYMIQSIKIGKKARKIMPSSNYDVLIWGMFVSVILTCINIDWLYGIYIFSVPIVLGINQYVKIETDITRNI